jgi:hypothetical protein
MNGVLRKAMLLACGGVVVASGAMASVPSPANSTIPNGIILVGVTGGVVDVRGEFTIIVRDLANSPIEGSSVVLSFDECEIDIRVATTQPHPGVSVDCLSGPVGEVSGVTDGSGSVTMRVVGGARNVGGNTPAEGFGCATVFADGVNMKQVNAAAFDQNSASGANPVDIALWLSDSLDGDFEGRSDYNATNTVNPVDLSLLLSASIAASSGEGGPYCH